MSGYINPLHTRVLPGQQSGYSSLGGAMPTGPGQPSLRRGFRLPQPAYVPKSKWHSATGRPNHPDIQFSMKGTAADPVPMRDLSARSVPGIFGMINAGEDRVLQNSGLSRITFRILWPGYESVEWARSIEVNAADGPITRARLGQMVAQNFSRFIEANRGVQSSNGSYHIGQNGIRFDHLFLVSIKNVSSPELRQEDGSGNDNVGHNARGNYVENFTASNYSKIPASAA
ncbi:hypothetical protein M413DRAFT_25663 [Hebeloma cylindrosporum]|uniref:Uncharacterized protein n=1 Tax=Hebeloma cylindrosporum TaxID=76867 RepID=A0A0C3C5T7_HEBCY|nr:hypothetical protein M413DRAFT_25663 [Hebeloma cylindrosporum h7]